MPLSLISFAISDSGRTPNAIRYLIAPGYVWSSHLNLGGRSFADSLSRDVWFIFTTDEAYYGLLIFLVLSLLRRHNTKIS